MGRIFPLLLLVLPMLPAQPPRIGVIDFYGLRRVPAGRLRAVLGASEGDELPGSKSDIEERLEQVPGVVLAHLEAVCCEGERAILYVGIEEKGAPHFEFRAPPAGSSKLPEAIVETYREFLRSFEKAARAGVTAEDSSQGHFLSRDPAARALQGKLQKLTGEHLETLRQVLRESADAEQRAIAAYAIAYAPRKRLVVNDLQYAMRDPDESVRANAIRSLGAIAALGARDPDLGIRVQPTWFIEMLNSIVWTDRYRAADALVGLTEKRDPYVLAQLRERALGAVIEMARWRTLAHALPAFFLAGRLAGLPEGQIEKAWTRGDRESVLGKLAGAGQAGRPVLRRKKAGK